MDIKNKYSLHSFLNKMSYFMLIIIFVIVTYFIIRDANDEVMQIVGILVIMIMFILVSILFIYGFKIFDYLVFTKENIILCSLFQKNKVFLYSEYLWEYGNYISILEDKKVIIFTPKDLGVIFIEVDTRKYGNCLYLNKNNILYCQYDKNLVKILNEIKK